MAYRMILVNEQYDIPIPNTYELKVYFSGLASWELGIQVPVNSVTEAYYTQIVI